MDFGKMNPLQSQLKFEFREKHMFNAVRICLHNKMGTKEVIDTKNAASCVGLWPMRVLITVKTTPTSILTGAEVPAIAKSHFAASSAPAHPAPAQHPCRFHGRHRQIDYKCSSTDASAGTTCSSTPPCDFDPPPPEGHQYLQIIR